MITDEQRAALELQLARWAEQNRRSIEERNGLVRVAVRNGLTKQRVHELTGLARTTIDRIVEGTHTG